MVFGVPRGEAAHKRKEWQSELVDGFPHVVEVVIMHVIALFE